jgi:hypothetical protein
MTGRKIHPLQDMWVRQEIEVIILMIQLQKD